MAESYFSPVEGLLPCCGPESTVINQLPVFVSVVCLCAEGGWRCLQAVCWQPYPQIPGPAIFSRGRWWGVIGFIWPQPAPLLLSHAMMKNLHPWHLRLVPPPHSSERPWQGMLGPAGHAGNAIGHSHGWNNTTVSAMGEVRGGGVGVG